MHQGNGEAERLVGEVVDALASSVDSGSEELRKAAKSGDDLAEVYPVVRRDNSGPMDRNNVSSTDELALLQKVELMHELFSRRAGGYFSHINKAIYGR